MRILIRLLIAVLLLAIVAAGAGLAWLVLRTFRSGVTKRFKAFGQPDEHSLSDAEQRQNTIMPWQAYAGMTREDLGAIYAFLRSQKPVVHRVDRFPDTAIEK